jgi:threonylcarbamoyladenosine tRNA methylthiotransferase MtaB
MGRRYDTATYAAIVERVRTALPGVAIHADVMAGFPTEDEIAHERSMAFIRSIAPAGLHVFRYSERPGTAASRMTGRVDPHDRRRRATDLLRLADEARTSFAATALGRERRVLFEGRDDSERWVGRSEDYLPVVIAHERALANQIGVVWIDAADNADPGQVVGRWLRAA